MSLSSKRDCLATEMRSMRNNPSFFPSILIIIVFLLLIFSIHVPAQTTDPDEQIKLQMIAYAVQTENALALSRPRIVQISNSSQRNDQKTYLKGFEISESEEVAPKTFGFEQKAFEILNEIRIEKGLEALEWNDRLAGVARLHSENMARFKFFSHAGLDGLMVNDRADALGISNWRSIGENIAYNRGFKKPVESACEQWMQSPSHRTNILNKKWRESGIGMAVAPDGTYYFTQVFILK